MSLTIKRNLSRKIKYRRRPLKLTNFKSRNRNLKNRKSKKYGGANYLSMITDRFKSPVEFKPSTASKGCNELTTEQIKSILEKRQSEETADKYRHMYY